MHDSVVIPDPAPQTARDLARFLVEACAPYTAIVTDRQSVYHFLTGQEVPFDDVWIPTESDIEGLDSVLKSYLQEPHALQRGLSPDPEYVLKNLRQYHREFSGFIENGRKYVICSMLLSHDIRRNPSNRFSIVFDGGASVVRVVFDIDTRKVERLECNGN